MPRPEDKKENGMKYFVKVFSLVSLFAVVFALFPATARAQRWVYVNDNNGNANANTATGFMNLPVNKLLPIGGSPWATHGTGLGNTLAVKNQALYTLGTPPNTACLFISDPAPSTGFPNGDIAAFTVNTVTGVLVLTGRFASPPGNSGNRGGIPLATGAKVLYAGYTASNNIVVWHVIVSTSGVCKLIFSAQIAAAGLRGGFVNGMRETPNFRTLVVGYGDGSIQSFTTPGAGIVAAPCAAPIISTGFTDGNSGEPAGVDIPRDSRYAVFGDSNPNFNNATELETAPLPLACATITKDFGGPIVASATFLGGAKDASNVWLSPNGLFIYVANASSQAITTVGYNEGLNTMALAAGCTAGHTNPTGLHLAAWTADAGIQTSTNAGTGTRLYVAEFGAPASVALLKVDGVGCTQEYPLSPFIDPNSNSTTNTWAALSPNAWPPRPF
jgi:hypothetical protein